MAEYRLKTMIEIQDFAECLPRPDWVRYITVELSNLGHGLEFYFWEVEPSLLPDEYGVFTWNHLPKNYQTKCGSVKIDFEYLVDYTIDMSDCCFCVDEVLEAEGLEAEGHTDEHGQTPSIDAPLISLEMPPNTHTHTHKGTLLKWQLERTIDNKAKAPKGNFASQL